MIDINRLKFRGQFLFSAYKCNQLEDWIEEVTGSHFLYVHPDCEFSKVETAKSRLYLIGFAINPHFPDKTSQQILEGLSHFSSEDDIFSLLYPLSGRFVLIIEINNRVLIFNDACGLRQVHYTKFKEQLFAASQPLLLQTVISITKSANAKAYFESRYVKYNKEHFLPSGISLYENVFHLVPNHYFDSEDFQQKRFWPSRALSPASVEESVQKVATLLKSSIYAANKRYKLALTLTSGRDSRILLSASKDFIDNIFIYTLQYRNLTKKSGDIKIPMNLSARLGFAHNLIECNKNESKEFRDIYTGNSDVAHWDDWGIIANSMNSFYPKGRLSVRGNCTEIGRCVYFKLGRHTKIKSDKDFRRHYYGYELDFIKERISDWFKESSVINKFGYDVYDFFYWEHRMGSWQAQSLLEWNIIHETFAPYNNRELLDYTLSVPAKLRCKPKFQFYNRLTQLLWEETLSEPINPENCIIKNKKIIKDFVLLVGIKIDLRRFRHMVSKIGKK